MTGHKKAVVSIAYFPLGSELASVAMDSSLILWDLEAAVPRTTLWAGTGDAMSSVVVIPDEPLIVAGQSDGTLRVWIPE